MMKYDFIQSIAFRSEIDKEYSKKISFQRSFIKFYFLFIGIR
jgi:hypothetical protein